MLFLKAELTYLRDNFKDLSSQPYFNNKIKEFVTQLAQVADTILKQHTASNRDKVADYCQRLWLNNQYLHGTIKNEVPYEMVSALRVVLSEWYTADKMPEIVTAYTAERNYFFEKPFAIRASQKIHLLKVRLPKLFKHCPLFNVAMYHELGHYLDYSFSVTKQIVIQNSASAQCDAKISLMHWSEHFADIVAAMYTGPAIKYFLQHICADKGESTTHPSLASRCAVIDDFLQTSHKNPIVVRCVKELQQLSLPHTLSYSQPDVDEAFAIKFPPRIADHRALHGILPAAWEYLRKAQVQEIAQWGDEAAMFTGVNDLVEKSIRNYFIVDKWNKYRENPD